MDAPRRRTTALSCAAVAVVAVVTGATVYQHRVRTGAGPLGDPAKIGWSACIPTPAGNFLAAESLWLINSARQPAVIDSVTTRNASNLRVLGYFVGEINHGMGGEHGSGGSRSMPLSAGSAALREPSLLGYVVPARMTVTNHAVQVAVAPVDLRRPWSYTGLTLRYHSGGKRYELNADVSLVVPVAGRPCTPDLLKSLNTG